MKIHLPFFRVSVGVALALLSPWALAQTCVAGTQASNPMSVYVIDNVNGTVTDRRTGLMWDRCARGQSGAGCSSGAAVTFTWLGALGEAALIGSYKGFSDWRLPNVKELRSLVEECRSYPSINEFAFPNTLAALFWSGSPHAGGGPQFAWMVNFQDGNSASAFRIDNYRVRLVRAGQ